ncbi:peptidylprolyl isomerase [Mesonia mobilis]|uniref:peptidylprolyl isomerase n=1 Tax=Mesonia mobilis TaxID=369791 RepID=UPI0024BBB1DE|nr:peptidylprolyl isomerase [Mesonia mobilis]
MKFTTKLYLLAFTLVTFVQANAQTTEQDSTLTITDKDNISRASVKKIDSVKPFSRRKADGIAAVIGDYLILDSDITKMREDAETQGVSASEITNCQLAGRLMENKLYAHQAMQDSTIVVSDAEISNMTDQQVSRMVSQIGSMEKLLDFYRKEDEQGLRDELFKINKERRLASVMQDRIVEEVEITPEEVREFFNRIPEDERPKFGDEVEIAQLVIKPEVPKEEEDKVVERLNEMRADILDGASFATKAVLYSEDATSSRGGQMTITREDPLDKDFKQVAFSLRAGEVSKPFKSEFGYHIIQLDKVRGQKLDIRHIIIIPKVTEATVADAKEKIEGIREEIVNGEITFDAAARKYSDEKETRGDGGQLINPKSGDTRFELTDVDPLIYEKVNNLEKGEVSLVLMDQNRTGQKFFKIITLTQRYPEHIADYSKDYTKIKELALREKQFDAIEKWQNEKIKETYIKINGDYKNCEFNSNWLKN